MCAITLSASLLSDVMLLLLLPSRLRLSCWSGAQHGTTGDAPLSFHCPVTDLFLVFPLQLKGEKLLVKELKCNLIAKQMFLAKLRFMPTPLTINNGCKQYTVISKTPGKFTVRLVYFPNTFYFALNT